ncbi:MAG: 6-aminohexanoate-dimer hydrolase [Planctomycetes bacterium ADurb.Bin126]|nr:MAG: 6-aminohexanoate-dimer hydrolase [Planctomycetes bacterium ADurb.Bin126]HOD80076.1 serine hydrolase [Phycisphaerae bacterium]HQL74508.1 serine hydrolase [Phycisphaerae bacterium]
MRVLPLIVLAVFSNGICAGGDLPRCSPEQQGVSSAGVQAFIEAADKNIDSLHSFMLLRHGHVLAEGWWAPYDAQSRHSLYSLSKSFTSTAVGLAVAEGKLSVDDQVLKFFPQDAPAQPSANLKSMRVSDLLRMSTGHQSEPARTVAEPWVKTFLAHPVPFKPGTHFLYNTSGTYMLSAIVQKATGQTVLEYLQPRLFKPLGIDNPTWETSPQGISAGGFGLSVRTEDIACFGQLFLQKGRWQGKQLLPQAWVEAATARQTSNGSDPNSDWSQGYGYQFWRCRHGAYRGDGAFGQYCVVLPDQDAVIAITSGLGNMQAVLNLVWDKLLPAFRPSPLPPDDAACNKLRQTLKGLTIRTQEGAASPAKAPAKKYVLPDNVRKIEAVSLDSGAGDTKDIAATLIATIGGADYRIACGRGKWIKQRIGRARAWPSPSDTVIEQPVAACGAWSDDATFTAKLCFYETPYIVTVRLKFSGDEVACSISQNVGFGGTKPLELVGKTQ